jgi:hypothetical protein
MNAETRRLFRHLFLPGVFAQFQVPFGNDRALAIAYVRHKSEIDVSWWDYDSRLGLHSNNPSRPVTRKHFEDVFVSKALGPPTGNLEQEIDKMVLELIDA